MKHKRSSTIFHTKKKSSWDKDAISRHFGNFGFRDIRATAALLVNFVGKCMVLNKIMADSIILFNTIQNYNRTKLIILSFQIIPSPLPFSPLIRLTRSAREWSERRWTVRNYRFIFPLSPASQLVVHVRFRHYRSRDSGSSSIADSLSFTLLLTLNRLSREMIGNPDIPN